MSNEIELASYDLKTQSGVDSAWLKVTGIEAGAILAKAKIVKAADDAEFKLPCSPKYAAMFRAIYSGILLPQIPAMVSTRPDLIKPISRLSVARQKKLVADGTVKVFEEIAPGHGGEHRMIKLLDLSPSEVRLVLDDERIDNVEAQKEFLRRKEKLKRDAIGKPADVTGECAYRIDKKNKTVTMLKDRMFSLKDLIALVEKFA